MPSWTVCQLTTNITPRVREGDVPQIEECGLWIVGALPRFFVLDGKVVDVFDLLAAAEALIKIEPL